MRREPEVPEEKDDKSAVAMLKKNDLHDRTWQPVVDRDESHDRTVQHGLVGRRSLNTRQLGCVGHGAAEAYLTEELRHAETNPTF